MPTINCPTCTCSLEILSYSSGCNNRFIIWRSKYCDIFQERFRDPKSLVKDLHDSGFKAIWMLDPGIKQEEGYFVYDSGSKNDAWVQKADGTIFVGKFSYICTLCSLVPFFSF